MISELSQQQKKAKTNPTGEGGSKSNNMTIKSSSSNAVNRRRDVDSATETHGQDRGLAQEEILEQDGSPDEEWLPEDEGEDIVSNYSVPGQRWHELSEYLEEDFYDTYARPFGARESKGKARAHPLDASTGDKGSRRFVIDLHFSFASLRSQDIDDRKCAAAAALNSAKELRRLVLGIQRAIDCHGVCQE